MRTLIVLSRYAIFAASIMTILLCSATPTPLHAQKALASPADSAMISSAGADIKVYYGRPSKRGREIFGKLVPFGEVWRTGANAATEIAFSKDILLGGKPVKAGRYSLFTIPQKDKWTVILSSKLKMWGAYEYNPKDDAMRCDVPVAPLKDAVEMFTIKFDKTDKGALLVMSWDQTSVSVPIEVKG